MSVSNTNKEDIEILTQHIETLYERISMLSQHNMDNYNDILNKYDSYTVYTQHCPETVWNIYTNNTFDQIDVSVYVSTGGYNQFKQMPALVTVNGSHIQIDFDMPFSGYVMYKDTSTNNISPKYPTIYGPDLVTLTADMKLVTVTDFDMTQASIVEDPLYPDAIIPKQPF